MKKLFEVLFILIFTFAFASQLLSNTYSRISEFNTDTVANFSSISLDEKIINTFIVFPNPAIDKLFIRFNDWQGTKEIKLLDITGKSVFISKTDREFYEIDISNFPKGIYLIHIRNEFLQVVKKIKIQGREL